MKKQTGFVIAKGEKAGIFFTSSSSYDRPQWVSVNEAAVYMTPDLANAAVLKLRKYGGAYAATIKSLSEVFDEEPALDVDPSEVTMDDDSTLDELPAASAYSGDEGGDVEAMDVDPDAEMEGPCPECECDPCECDGEESAYGADGELEDGGEIAPMDGEAGGDVSIELEMPDDKPKLESQSDTRAVLTELSTGTLSDYIKKATKSVKDLVDADDMVKGVKRGKNVVWAKQKVKERNAKDVKESTEVYKEVKMKDPAVSTAKPDADLSHAGALPHEDSITVPSELLAQLKKVVDAFRKEAEEKDGIDDTRGSFCLTAADALQQVYDDLSAGTSLGMKQAQIHMTSFMSPITNQIPADVITFITRGGRKSNLKDLFSGIKESKRVDYDTMADRFQSKKG
jgi:hypothetical protein